ncbi:hypothetical protein [Nocardiopsis lambiniae]|uniref:ATP/GTP-binding protein n=1 Tax=Nocardiopsis lambiniae TaxID=3075539 RepID=A0ABU2MEX5_9ACTN|nr:hypothetical protein [Nocardiopsis sp. DSM 44743]MDT0331177.1 hypothetical protein [Nocardiopsis sp. DSM 44743]
MLRPLPPAATAVAAVLVFATVGAAPAAHADDGSFLGSVQCGTSGGNGCQILLRWLLEHGGTPGTPGTGGTGGAGGSGGTGGGTGSGEYDDVDWDAIDWDAIDWSQIDWDSMDWDAIFAEAAEGEEGTDPLTALEEAMASFELPEPKIATSPGTDSLVLVNTPLWLWVEPEDWDAESVSAQLGSTSLTVSATPARTAWTMGDGSTVECEGPGTPFDASTHDAASASPDCGHVYTSASDTAAEGAHTVTVRVLWDTEWSFSGGESGTLEQLTSTSEVDLTVRESHGLVTDTQ